MVKNGQKRSKMVKQGKKSEKKKSIRSKMIKNGQNNSHYCPKKEEKNCPHPAEWYILIPNSCVHE